MCIFIKKTITVYFDFCNTQKDTTEFMTMFFYIVVFVHGRLVDWHTWEPLLR